MWTGTTEVKTQYGLHTPGTEVEGRKGVFFVRDSRKEVEDFLAGAQALQEEDPAPVVVEVVTTTTVEFTEI